jgi:hypothetical protein
MIPGADADEKCLGRGEYAAFDKLSVDQPRRTSGGNQVSVGVSGRAGRGVRYWGGRAGYRERLAKGQVGLASVAQS